jgi:predicted HAD superfamily Cof-like phosphohydrolase
VSRARTFPLTLLHTYAHRPMKALRQWHKAVGEKRLIERDLPQRLRLLYLRMGLIEEEFEEVMEVMQELVYYPEDTDAREHLAKELADLLYVVYGTADLLDIPLETVFRAVHESNLTKIGPDGKVIRREDGKILKPDTYRPADVHGALTGEWL